MTGFCFDRGQHKYTSVNRFGVKWICKPDCYSVVFDKYSFKKAIEWVLDNCFLEYGSKVFQQVVTAGSRPGHFYGEIFFIFILRGENQASPGAEILRIVGTTTKRKKLSYYVLKQ